MTNTTSCFYNLPKLRWVGVGPGFFKTKQMWSFGYCGALGMDDGGESNGWLEDFVAQAPRIRAKAGYGEDESAELLEEEDGEWWLNDGYQRMIALHLNLGSKAWAMPLMQALAAKGYKVTYGNVEVPPPLTLRSLNGRSRRASNGSTPSCWAARRLGAGII